MIVVVKRKNYKRIFIKILVYVAVIAMFIGYYIYTDKKLKELTKLHQEKLKKEKAILDKKEQKARKIERIIYNEAEAVVDIIGQKYIQSCKVAKKRLIFVIDANVSIEPMLVRYGANMLVKYEKKRTLTAVDINFILKDKYKEKTPRCECPPLKKKDKS